MKIGRPTKYEDKTPEEWEKAIEEWKKSTGNQYSVDGKLLKVVLPTIERISLHFDLVRDTFYEWAKIHKLFSDTKDWIEKQQKIMLLESGLDGKYNAMIAKFVLSSNHGMTERTESKTDVTSGGKPILGGVTNLPNVPTNHSNEKDTESDKENTSNTGGDEREQDDIDSTFSD